MTTPVFTVGQRVWVHGHNIKEPYPLTVTKVGRKLVTVEHYGRPIQYRIEDGTINDNYGHSWIFTDAGREDHERRNAALTVLNRVRWNQMNTEALEAIVAILQKDKDS